MMKRYFGVWFTKQNAMLVLCGLFWGAHADLSLAQNTSINSHIFRFGDSFEQISIEGAIGPDSEIAQHKAILHISTEYVSEALIGIDLTRSTQVITIVDDLVTTQLGGGVLITPRIFAGLNVPLHYVRLGSVYSPNDRSSYRLGDISAYMKFRLSGDDAFLNVAVMPYGAFPTGRIGNDAIRYLVTDDSFIYGAKILVDKKWGLFDTYVNLGYSRAENASFLNIDRTSRMDYAGGVFVPLLPNRKLGLMGEVLGAVTVPSFDKDQNPVEVHFGARAQWGTVRLYAGAGLEAFRKARSNDLSLFIGAKIPLGSKKEPKPFVEPEPEPKIETEPEPEVVELQRRIQILKEKLSVRREINFKTNEAVILPESYSELDSAAEIIAEHSNQIQAIVIEGHTDSQGKDAYNLKLSQRRAESVKQYMVDKGIDPAKLRAIGYGESRPKVEEVDSESRRINRRVEFTVEAEIEIEKEVIEETGQSLVPQELPKEVDPNSNELQSLDSQGVEADSDSVFEENPERGSDASEDLEWDDIQDENSEGEADELGF